MIDRRSWVDPTHPNLPVRKQCELLAINRSSLYIEPRGENETNLNLMQRIDEIYTKHPFYGRSPMARGFVHLAAVIDWFSRYVLSWRLSNTLDKLFCTKSLKEALEAGVKPEIFNTDQGSQLTSRPYFHKYRTGILKESGISISMDGRGRALDNVFIERLWRSVKYEEVYLNSYESVRELEQRLDRYFRFYNEERPHQSLQYKKPSEIYRGTR